MNTQKPILRKIKVDDLIEFYYETFEEFKSHFPDANSHAVAVVFDKKFNEAYLQKSENGRQEWKL
jgi:hypothetical protein